MKYFPWAVDFVVNFGKSRQVGSDRTSRIPRLGNARQVMLNYAAPDVCSTVLKTCLFAIARPSGARPPYLLFVMYKENSHQSDSDK